MTATSFQVHNPDHRPLEVCVYEHDFAVVVELKCGDATVDVFTSTAQSGRSAGVVADEMMCALRDATRVDSRNSKDAA